MAAIKLYETTDRDECHIFLALILGTPFAPDEAREKRARAEAAAFVGKHPAAECREEGGLYSVWSCSAREDVPAPVAAPVEAEALPARMHPDDLEALAERLAAKLKGFV